MKHVDGLVSVVDPEGVCRAVLDGDYYQFTSSVPQVPLQHPQSSQQQQQQQELDQQRERWLAVPPKPEFMDAKTYESRIKSIVKGKSTPEYENYRLQVSK